MPNKKGVIDFNRDEAFYASHGKTFYNNSEYLRAIKYFLNVPYLKKEYHDVAMMLADCYIRFQLVDNALFVYFSLCTVCDEEELSVIYLKISEILFFFDKDLTKYYLSKVQDGGDKFISQEADFRLDKILEVERDNSSRIKEVSEVSSDLQLKLLMEGKYDAVLELMGNNHATTPAMREAVELSYISLNRDEECLKFISSLTAPLSVVELCIYFFCLSHRPDAEKLKEVREQIKNPADLEETKLPLCINILCLAGDSQLALDLTQKYISNNGKIRDYRLQILYAKLLIGAGEFDKAREILVELKGIDTFHTAIYKELLDLCETKSKFGAIQVISILPYKSHAKILKDVKHFFTLSNEEMLNQFEEIKDCFYYVAENAMSREMARFMTSLVDKDSASIRQFVNFLLLSRNINSEFKKSLVLAHYKYSNIRDVFFTIDDILLEYKFPPLQSINDLSHSYFSATCHSITYFLMFFSNSMDFRDMLEGLPKIKIKRDEVLLLASFMTFTLSQHLQPGTKLKDVLKYFMLTEQDFYAFLEKYNLEI